MKLEFGNPRHIEAARTKRRKKRNQAAIKVEDDVLPDFEFPLCAHCYSKCDQFILQPSDMFKFVCGDCKDRFMRMTTKHFLVGAFIKVNNSTK